MSPTLKKMTNTRLLKLQTLNGLNKIVIINATHSEAQNLYQSKLTQLANMSIEGFRGNLFL